MKVTDQIEFGFTKIIKDKFDKIDEKHGWIDYFIAPVITAVILLLVYYLKGVYPFGRTTIAYYDMTSNYITGYSYTWDVLHGICSPVWSWYCGLGLPSVASTSDFVLFPVNLFFYFVSRDNILFSISILLLIYMVLCAFTISLYFKKHFDNTLVTVSAGLLYSFSGFLLQDYTNLYFLNLMVLLPLIVWGLERLMLEHKYVMFIVFASVSFTLTNQHVFMLCIYILFKSYFIFNKVSEEEKGRSLRLLFLSVFISFLFASLIQIPATYSILKSTRISGTSDFDYVSKMKNVVSFFRRNKHFMLYGSEISIGLLLLILCRGKKIWGKYSDNIKMILLLSLPILHEGITLLWHAGSYKHFPMRFGYMLTFECLVLVGSYFMEEKFYYNKIVGKTAKLVGIAAIPFIAYVLFEFCKGFCDTGSAEMGPFSSYWIYIVALSLSYFVAFLMETGASRRFAVLSLVLIQCFCGCYGFIAPQYGEYDNFRIKYTRNSIELRRELENEVDFTKRIKSNPSEYESNYSIIARRPAIGFWSYTISPNLENELSINMKYDGGSSYGMDSGGTVFTDALLGVAQYASSYNPDDRLYSKADGHKIVYDSRYTMPFGIVTDVSSFEDESVAFEHNNKLFKVFTGLNDQLVSYESAADYIDDVSELTEYEENEFYEMLEDTAAKLHGENKKDEASEDDLINSNNESVSETSPDIDKPVLKKYVLSVPIENEQTLYLYATEDNESGVEIMVNDKPIIMDSFITYGEWAYPNKMRNGMVALGTYEDEVVDICIYTTNSGLGNLEIGKLDLEVLASGIEAAKKNQSLDIEFGKDSFHVKGNTYKAGTLVLPIGYLEGWHAKVNGVKTVIKPYINNALISVEVPEGAVDIEFSYRPSGFVLGIILFLIGVATMIALVISMKNGGIVGWKYGYIVDKVFIYGYLTIVAVFLIFMYVVPIYLKMAL